MVGNRVYVGDGIPDIPFVLLCYYSVGRGRPTLQNIFKFFLYKPQFVFLQPPTLKTDKWSKSTELKLILKAQLAD